MIRNSIIKLVSISLIVGLNWFGLSAVIETVAYFNDTETSGENSFSAATLDFSLTSPGDFSPEVTPTATSSRNINLTNDGLLGFNYSVSSTSTTGVLCDDLVLTAKLEGNNVYTGPLASFNYNAGEFSSTTDEWQFTANLTSNDSSLQNQTCAFDFVFDGTQIEGAGFYDQEIISNTITAGIWQKVVINKVYYDVDNKHGTETNNENEWIELYNLSDNPVDISGWKIIDNNATDTIPASNPIPAHGFAVITGNASTWGYWNIPDGVVKIVLTDGKIGNGLANEGDRVILKMPDGTEDDAMSYGTDTYAFSPPCPDVSEGHILARVPTGIDTNTASDWKDLGLPQVTVTSPTGGGWYCAQNVNLKWTATNPNGPNSDLKITLLYIRDLDKNGVVSNGDGITTIAQDIANTGNYNWTVSPCYYGYVWIKVIAVGPENFIVSNSGLSGRVFEPPAPEGVSLEELPEDCCSIEMFADIIAEYEASLNGDNECAAPSAAQAAEEPIIEEPTPGVGEDEEITEEEPAVIEETPAEEPVIEEIPPAIEENPPVIEQAPNPEELPPPPPLEPSPEPDPNL